MGAEGAIAHPCRLKKKLINAVVIEAYKKRPNSAGVLIVMHLIYYVYTNYHKLMCASLGCEDVTSPASNVEKVIYTPATLSVLFTGRTYTSLVSEWTLAYVPEISS